MTETKRHGESGYRQQLRDLEALVRVVGRINHSLEIKDVLTTSLTEIQPVVAADFGCFLLFPPEAGKLEIIHSASFPPALYEQLEKIDPHLHPTEWTQLESQRQALSAVGESVKMTLVANKIASYVILPLVTRNQSLGLLFFGIGEHKLLAPKSIDLLMSIGEQIGMAIENARLHARLKESEAWSRDFIENSADAFIEGDLTGKIYFVNDAACRLLGYDRMALHKLRVENLLPLSEQERAARRQALVENGYTINASVPFTARGGENRIASITSRLIRDGTGQPIRFQSIVRDVTAQQRAMDTLTQRNAELAALNAIANILSNPLDFDHALDQVCEQIISITGMESVIIFLAEDSKPFLDIVAHRGISKNLYHQMRRVGLDDPSTRYVAVEGKVFATNDLTLYQGEGIAGPRSEGYRAGIAVPIFKRDTSIGILEVGSKTQTNYEQADIDLLLNIGWQIGKALDNIELYTQMQARVKELAVINSIAEILNHPLEITQALDQVCEKISSITNMETVSLYLNDEQNQFMRLLAQRGYSDFMLAEASRVGLDDPMTRHIAVEGKTIALNDIMANQSPSFAGPKMEGYHAGIGVPILKHQVPVGAIFVGSKVQAQFIQSDVELLLNIGRQVGVALANSELVAALQRRVEELDGLAQLSVACSSSLELDTMTASVVAWTQKLLQADGADLRLLESNHLFSIANQVSRPEYAWNETFDLGDLKAVIVDQRMTLSINDVQTDPDVPPLARHGLEPRGLRALLVVPLQARDQVIGTLAVLNHLPRRWSAHEIELLQTIANQIGVATQNANLYTQMQRRLTELDGLAKLSAACTGTFDPAELCEIAVDWTHRLLPVDFAIVHLLQNNSMRLAAKYTRSDVQLGPEIAVDNEFGPIITQSKKLIINDTSQSTLSPFHREEFLAVGIRSIVVVPMPARDHVIGALAIAYEYPHVWEQNEINLVRTIANQVANAIDSAQLFQNVLGEQRKVQAIFDSGISGLFATNAKGCIEMFNHAAESITGWSRDQVLGKKWEELFNDPTQDLLAEPLINEALLYKHAAFVQDGRSILTRDGRIIPVAKAVAPLFDDKGNVTGAVGAFWDLSKEKVAELEREEFLKEVAHQLRSPLTAVLSAMQLLERPTLSEDRRAEMWLVLKNSGERLRRFADQFLDLEAVMKSRRPLNLEPVAIIAIVRAMVKELRHDKRKHRFHVVATPKNLTAFADADRIENILRNLLENAMTYSPEGSLIKIKIKPSMEDMLEVAVCDRGMGIPLEDQGKIFLPFYRSASTQKRSIYGHGLGLAIAKRSVEEMNGHIWVESKLGQGASFHFTLRRFR